MGKAMPVALKTLIVVLLGLALLMAVPLFVCVSYFDYFTSSFELLRYFISSVVTGGSMVCAVAMFVCFLRAVIRSKEFFSHAQTKRIFLVGVALAVRVVFDLLAPTFSFPAPPGGVLGPIESLPSLNLSVVAMSLMFFALAGVFEYGRILQEDSDNIL